MSLSISLSLTLFLSHTPFITSDSYHYLYVSPFFCNKQKGGFAKVRRGRNDLLIESDCMWVIPSGWGSPGHNWESYDTKKVNKAAKELMLSSDILLLTSLGSPLQEEAILSEGRLWLTLVTMSLFILLSITFFWFQSKKSKSNSNSFPVAKQTIEMNAPLNSLRPFSQTTSYTSI